MAWKGMRWAAPPVSLAFDDDTTHLKRYDLKWSQRQQPDLGGALNFAWMTRQAPIKEMLGTSVAALTPLKPIGQPPMIPVMMRPNAGMGVYTGGIVHQPLTDPLGLNPGGLTGAPWNLTQGLA